MCPHMVPSHLQALLKVLSPLVIRHRSVAWVKEGSLLDARVFMRIEGLHVPIAVTSSLPILRVSNLAGGDMTAKLTGVVENQDDVRPARVQPGFYMSRREYMHASLRGRRRVGVCI